MSGALALDFYDCASGERTPGSEPTLGGCHHIYFTAGRFPLSRGSSECFQPQSCWMGHGQL